jgi:hypothetical protein
MINQSIKPQPQQISMVKTKDKEEKYKDSYVSSQTIQSLKFTFKWDMVVIHVNYIIDIYLQFL